MREAVASEAYRALSEQHRFAAILVAVCRFTHRTA